MKIQGEIKDSHTLPKISVTVLTYNRATLLPRAVHSVLNQTFSDFELVIINNGSTDTTDEVVKSFNDKRIVYKKYEKNRGFWGGFNAGLDAARGKYLIHLSDDDELLPDALETIVTQFAKLSPKGIKILLFDCIDAESGGYGGFGIRKEGYVSYEDYLCDKITGDYIAAMDRDIIGSNRVDLNLWGGIYTLFSLKLYRNNRAFYIPKVLYKAYHEHGEGRIFTPEAFLFNDGTKIILTLKAYLKEYGQETKMLCPKGYGQRLASLGLYQILNNEKKEGRSNILESFKSHFSLNYCFLFILSFVLSDNQLKYVCSVFLKTRKKMVNLFGKFSRPVIN